jgi:AcrR family transcriptional regulator
MLHGFAGACVDRIVSAARTNKAQLYAYFGSKKDLFDTIFLASLERITNVVPIDAEDLANWATRPYDEYLRRPDRARRSDRPDGRGDRDLDGLVSGQQCVRGNSRRTTGSPPATPRPHPSLRTTRHSTQQLTVPDRGACVSSHDQAM